MYKIFPRTENGDQIRVEFEYDEERVAFEKVVEQLRSHIATMRTENEIETNKNKFKFETTLQMDVASDYNEIIRTILGLKTLNIYGKDRVVVIPIVKE